MASTDPEGMRKDSEDEMRVFDVLLTLMDKLGMMSKPDVKRSAMNLMRFYLPRIIIIEIVFELFSRSLFFCLHYSDGISMDMLAILIYGFKMYTVMFIHLVKVYWSPMELRQILLICQDVIIKHCSQSERDRKTVQKAKRNGDGTLQTIYNVLFCAFHIIVPSCAYHFATTDIAPILYGRCYPYDTTQSPAYEITVFLYCYFLGLGWVYFFAIQFLIITLLYNFTWQYRVLQDKLLNIRADSLEHIMAKYHQKTEDSRPSADLEVMELRQGGGDSFEHIMAHGLRNITNNRTIGEKVAGNVFLDIPRAWAAVRNEKLMKTKADVEKRELDLEMERRMKECVEHHKELNIIFSQTLSFCEPILVSGVFFFFLMAALVVVCVSAVEAMHVMAWGAVILSIFGSIVLASYCWWSDMLTDANEGMRDAAYGCDWFEASESFKRSMRIVMSMSNQPVVIRALNFVPLSMETFLAELKTAHSYYSLISKVIK